MASALAQLLPALCTAVAEIRPLFTTLPNITDAPNETPVA